MKEIDFIYKKTIAQLSSYYYIEWRPIIGAPGTNSNNLPLALAPIAHVLKAHSSQTSFKYFLAKGFGEWVRYVVRCVYALHSHVSSSNDFSYQSEFPQNMFGFLMRSRLFCLRNSPVVITVDRYWIPNGWNDTQFLDEVPHLNNFFCSLICCNKFCFSGGVG